MKKVVSIVTMMVMLLVAVPVFAASVPAGYTAIASQADLQAIGNNLSGKYMLTQDILLSGTFTPIATDPDSPFTGTLDGAGFTISNLTVAVETNETAVGGLFGYNEGTVSNLILSNVNVLVDGIDPYASSYTYAGAVAAVNVGTVENCKVTGSVCGSSLELTAYVGGIVGENRGTVAKCGNNATVEAVGISEVAAGGVVGWNKGTVENSYNANTITGTASAADTLVRVGGIAGKNGFAGVGTISKCHNVGALSAADGEGYVGGISGNNLKTIQNCYYLNTTASAQVGTATATTGALSNANFKVASNFSGFDFTNVWVIDQYPVLKGQDDQVQEKPKGDANGDGTIGLADVLYLMRYCNGHSGVSINYTECDLNGDSIIDIVDAIRLIKQING